MSRKPGNRLYHRDHLPAAFGRKWQRLAPNNAFVAVIPIAILDLLTKYLSSATALHLNWASSHTKGQLGEPCATISTRTTTPATHTSPCTRTCASRTSLGTRPASSSAKTTTPFERPSRTRARTVHRKPKLGRPIIRRKSRRRSTLIPPHPRRIRLEALCVELHDR